MKCKNCGTQASDGEIACLRCGAKFGFANTDSQRDIGAESADQDTTGSVSPAEATKPLAVYFGYYLDFMKRLVTEHMLVTCVVVYAGYVILSRMNKFNSVPQTGLTLLVMLILAPAGIWVGEQFRRFATPDAFLAGGMLDIFKKKLMFMYGPQIVGGVVGALLAVGLTGVATNKIASLFSSAQTQSEVSRPAAPRIDSLPPQSAVPVAPPVVPDVKPAGAPASEVLKTQVTLTQKPIFTEEGTHLSTDKGAFALQSKMIPQDAMDILDKADKGDCLIILSDGPVRDTIKGMQTCGR